MPSGIEGGATLGEGDELSDTALLGARRKLPELSWPVGEVARTSRRCRAGAVGPRPDPLGPAGGLSENPGLDRHGDEATGANIVKVALEAPLKQIAVDAGLEGGVAAEEVRGLTAGEGLDARLKPAL
jgi:hypothetical protein